MPTKPLTVIIPEKREDRTRAASTSSQTQVQTRPKEQPKAGAAPAGSTVVTPAGTLPRGKENERQSRIEEEIASVLPPPSRLFYGTGEEVREIHLCLWLVSEHSITWVTAPLALHEKNTPPFRLLSVHRPPLLLPDPIRSPECPFPVSFQSLLPPQIPLRLNPSILYPSRSTMSFNPSNCTAMLLGHHPLQFRLLQRKETST